MEDLKKKVIDTVSAMDDKEILTVWNFITSRDTDDAWDNIPEAAPDEWDLAMLKHIDSNPECHEFVSIDKTLDGISKRDTVVV